MLQTRYYRIYHVLYCVIYLTSVCITGRMFATFGALQSLSTLIGNVIYNNIYPLTLSFWPGFSFMLGGLLGIVPFSLIA